MNTVDWDDEAEIERWCGQQRAVAAAYLSRQPGEFGALGDSPAWDVAPYVAVWAVESVKAPGKVGWWVISGDLPTDYASGAATPSPRAAVAAIARRWAEVSSAMERGEISTDVAVGTPAQAAELGPLLASRARILTELVGDDSLWDSGALAVENL